MLSIDRCWLGRAGGGGALNGWLHIRVNNEEQQKRLIPKIIRIKIILLATRTGGFPSIARYSRDDRIKFHMHLKYAKLVIGSGSEVNVIQLKRNCCN